MMIDWMLDNHHQEEGCGKKYKPVQKKVDSGYQFHCDLIIVLASQCLQSCLYSEFAFYRCDKATRPEVMWGGKGLFHHTILRSHSSLKKEVRAGTQGGILEAGTKAGAME